MRKVYCLTGLLIVMVLHVNASDSQKREVVERVDAVIRTHYGADASNAPGLGIMVTRHGELQFKKAYGIADLEHSSPLTTSTNLRMASVSKQFTSMATYLLIEQGILSFDTPLSEIFDNLPAWSTQITVGHLMNHTSGIWDYEVLIPRDQQEQVSDADVLQMISSVDSTYFTPGSQFRYSNTGYCLLSLIVERVSNTDYREYMKEHIFQPLGMTNAYMYHAGTDMLGRAFGYRPPVAGRNDNYRYADQSITSATKGDGCVYVSPEGYHTWANAVLRTSFPSSAYLTQVDQRKTPVKDGIYYSMGWFVAPANSSQGMRLFHSGETTGFRNIVYHNLGTGLSISIFANRDDTHISAVFEEIVRLMGEAHPVVSAPEHQELFFWMSSVY